MHSKVFNFFDKVRSNQMSVLKLIISLTYPYCFKLKDLS